MVLLKNVGKTGKNDMIDNMKEDELEDLIVRCIRTAEKAWKRTRSFVNNEGICITMLANTLLCKSLENKKLKL